MNEGKEYASQPEEMGSINISEEVVATIAAVASSEVEGVSGLSANIGSDIAELLGKKNLSKGIKIQIVENIVTVDSFVMIKYGYAIPETAKKIQESVINSIESMTGLAVGAVNVHIGGISFDKDVKK